MLSVLFITLIVGTTCERDVGVNLAGLDKIKSAKALVITKVTLFDSL